LLWVTMNLKRGGRRSDGGGVPWEDRTRTIRAPRCTIEADRLKRGAIERYAPVNISPNSLKNSGMYKREGMIRDLIVSQNGTDSNGSMAKTHRWRVGFITGHPMLCQQKSTDPTTRLHDPYTSDPLSECIYIHQVLRFRESHGVSVAG
jgi:hypothetical protein